MKFKHGKNLRLIGKRTIFIDKSALIGNNVTIYENNRIEGDTVIGNNVVILPNCYIKDTVIGDDSVIDSSHTLNATVGKMVSVGPFARLRPMSIICDRAKIGNFVEIKNAVIGKGSKVSHLAYVGDAEIGENCNIGCGAIFVNYNGKIKQKTVVGDNCFIGSNCNVIAPVNIEKNSYVCAGTTVTDNVKSDEFVIGRVRQEVKENRAHRYLKEMKGE